MPNEMSFPNLEEAAARLGSRRDLTPEEARELLCHDCDFWHEGHEDDLECSCYRILRIVIESGALTPAELAAAVGAMKKPGD